MASPWRYTTIMMMMVVVDNQNHDHGGGSDAHHRRHAAPFATTMRVAMQRVRCMYQKLRTFAATGRGSTSTSFQERHA